MDARIRKLESQVDDLVARVARLEAVGAVTKGVVDAPAERANSVSVLDPGKAAPQRLPAGANWVRWASLVGRSFLVLGGGYLIRALTEEAVLPRVHGTILGLSFGVAWIVVSFIDARRQRIASSTFYGASAALITFPLIFEASTRLGTLSPVAAAATLAAFTALLAILSWRQGIPLLAWIAVTGCVATAVGVYFRGGGTPLHLVLLGTLALSVWLSTDRRWRGLPWPTALVADFITLRAVASATRPDTPLETLMISMWLGVALLTLSIAALAYRTFARRVPVRVFDGVQAVAGLGIGMLGIFCAARASGVGTAWMGVVALAFAAASYATGLWALPRREHQKTDVYFYAGVGAALVFVGGILLTAGPWRAVLWATLSLVAAATGRLAHTGALWSHAAAFAWGAALTSGLLQLVDAGLVADVGAAPEPPGPDAVFALTLAGASYLAAALPSRPELNALHRRIPAASLLLLVALVAAALLVLVGRWALSQWSQDAGVVAASRTVALGAAAALLALLRRRLWFEELGWISYALLGALGLKLLFEDLRVGRAATLLVTFVVYGLLLIAVPKLIRSARQRAAGEPAAPPEARR